MSDILKRWLEDDVGLAVNSFEKDFASGYLFGQLFSRYNLQPDVGQFDAKRMPDTMISNFTRLQPTFQKLGIPMDTRVANALIREEPGVAARLLYSIKQNVTNLNKSLSSFQHTGNLGRSLGASVSPSRVFLDAQQHNSKKEAYQTGAHRHFEDTMRSQALNANALMESMHLAQYTAEGQRQNQAVLAGMLKERSQKLGERSMFRATQLGKLSSARSDKTQKLLRDDAVHASLVKRKEDIEREELRVELALAEKARRKKLEELQHSSRDVNAGIDAFEVNMKRLVRGDQAEGEEALAPPAGKSPLEHMEKVKSRAVATAKLLEDTAAYMRSVKDARADDVAAKREREARRRKMVVEQQAGAAEAERKAQSESLLASLQRQSAEEQRLAARLWQVGQEKEAMRENRALRERQYTERRERDWEDTLKREMELHRSMREEYEAEAALEMEAWRAAQEARTAAKAAQHAELVTDIAWQLVQLAERTVEQRSNSGEARVPRREWREWLAMFVSGDAALGTPVVRLSKEEKAEAEARRQQAQRLARVLVGDYLRTEGDWVLNASASGGGAGSIGHNELLGRVVGELAVLAREVPPPPQAPALEGLPLRLAVVGAPFAGKTAITQELARKYRLRVLEPEGVIAEAMAAADDFQVQLDAAAAARAAADGGGEQAGAALGVGAEDAPPLEPSTKARLGQELRAALREGRDVPDAALVALMVEAMKETKGWVPPGEAVDPKAKKPAAAPGAKGAPPPPEPVRGFVLDGFPRTAAQAVLMERLLTGLDLAAEQALVDGASAIAPPEPDQLPQVSRPLMSGLDAVVVCGLSDEPLALKRALGRRRDPSNGRIYHLEFDAPPATDPGLSARLVPVHDSSNDAQQIQKRLAAHADLAAPLDDWLRRFSRLRRPVEGGGPLKEVLASAGDVVEGLLRAKAAAASCCAAAEAAHKARASAEQAHEFATIAQGAAEAAAAELLLAKKAEIQATALLAATGAPAGGGKDKKDKDAPPPDPAATEVLKAQAAAKCAEQLKVARTAVSDANSHAERATSSAAAAADAVERARKSLGDAEVSAHAESEAAAAATEADRAAKGAGEAAQKALAAKQAAEAAAAEAERFFTASDVAPDAQLQLPPAAGPSSSAAAAAATPRPGGGAAEGSALEPPPVARQLAASLHEEWRTLEASYLEGLALCFAALSDEHGAVQAHFGALRQRFQDLLARPDEKPALVARFQAAFNAVEGDLRPTKEARAELVLRCEEVREALWALCDRKMEEAEAQRAKVAADSFVADRGALLGQQFVALAQVEADRFAAALNFLRSYVHARWAPLLPAGKDAPGPSADVAAPDLMSGQIPAELKDKLDPKSKTLMAMPAFIAPLEAKAPALAACLKTLVAMAACTAASWEPQPEDPKAAKAKAAAAAKKPAAGGKGGKGAAEEEEEKADPRVVDAVYAELLAGCRREVSMLEARLRLLAERCVGQIDEVGALAAATHAQLGKWVRSRYRAECGAVSALDAIVKRAALEGKQLPADLRLEDDALTLDESSLVVSSYASLPAARPREQPLPGGLLRTGQLAGLTRAFLTAAPSGFIRLQDAADMLCRLAVEGVLPAAWRAASVTQMLGALRLYDPVFSTYMDWREFVAHLVVAAFPLVAKADCTEMADQVEICAEADRDGDGLLTEVEWYNLELWFQYKAFQAGSEADLEAEHALRSHSGSDDADSSATFDAPGALKDVLWELFASPAGSPDGHPRLDFRACLLYLSADRDWFAGIKKAFSVATRSISGNARAGPGQVVAMAYPLGPEAGKDLHRSPLSPHEVERVVQGVFQARGGAAGATPSVSAEQLMYSSAGEQLVKRLFDRYAWKDAFVATKL